MSLNDSTSPDELPPREGAAYWLATLTDASCSESDRREFYEWLRSSTKNVDEFLRLSMLMRDLERREVWPSLDVDELIAKARAENNVTQIGSPLPVRVERRTRTPLAIAASFLGALVLGTSLFFADGVRERLTSTYSTEVGEQRSLSLDDGSVVQLNSRSRLRTRFNDQARTIEMLDGEAIFKVAKDPSRPFRVRTGMSEIVAIGTEFNVNANGRRTIVTVMEGKVRVNGRSDDPSGSGPITDEDSFYLIPGEQLIIDRNHPAVRIALPSIQPVISWTERRLTFDDTALALAAQEFARHSARTISIEDPVLARRRITGVFDATDPESLVQFLATDPKVEVFEDGQGWRIARKHSQ